MDLVVFDSGELVAVLRALVAIARSNAVFTPAERDFVAAVAQLHGMTVDPYALRPIQLREVARAVVDPHKRKRAVQLAIVAALVEGPPPDVTTAAVRELARALEVDDGGLGVLSDLASDRLSMVRFDVVRRMGRFVGARSGLAGFARLGVNLLGFCRDDAELAARYRKLGECEEGTLGRALYDHLEGNGFGFPGEKSGPPEEMFFHDVGHVLSGYGVDPQSEIQQAAFQAGFVRNDGFLFLLFGILQFHIGVKITPVAEGYEGLFDVERVMEAARRGAACTVDLSAADWDLWDEADRPLAEVRARYGIPPLRDALA